jgi:hypothetical protein
MRTRIHVFFLSGNTGVFCPLECIDHGRTSRILAATFYPDVSSLGDERPLRFSESCDFIIILFPLSDRLPTIYKFSHPDCLQDHSFSIMWRLYLLFLAMLTAYVFDHGPLIILRSGRT